MKQLAYFLFVIPALLISGCTSSQSGGTGAGLVISTFEPDVAQVYSGEPVKFFLKIKNLGSFAADGAVRMDLSGWGGDCQTGLPREFSNIIAPDQETGATGEEISFTWECDAPEVDEGLHVPYEPRSIVTYHYHSLTSQAVTLLPTTELIAQQDAGNYFQTQVESVSNSPVRIDVIIEGSIRVRRDTNGIEFPVVVKLYNEGNGIVEGSSIRLDVTGRGGIYEVREEDCHFENLHLWRDRAQTITCDMQVHNIEGIRQAWIEADAEYDYTVTGTTNIEVIGQRKAFM
jgi:hypothetical protein